MSSVDTEAPPLPTVDETDGSVDKRKRHVVQRIGGPTSLAFSKVALCGEKVTELVPDHSDDVCQKCVDILKTRGPE